MRILIRPKPPNLIDEPNVRFKIYEVLNRAFCFALRNLLDFEEEKHFVSFFTATRKQRETRYC